MLQCKVLLYREGTNLECGEVVSRMTVADPCSSQAVWGKALGQSERGEEEEQVEILGVEATSQVTGIPAAKKVRQRTS